MPPAVAMSQIIEKRTYNTHSIIQIANLIIEGKSPEDIEKSF
jgi:hypothetical protein